MRLRALDGLRGTCSVLIALAHLEMTGYVGFGGWLTRGHVLVDVFFVLSGFVIALVYADRLGDAAGSAAFLVRRLGRVWPLHAAVLTLFVGAELAKMVAAAGFGYVPHFAPFTGQRPLDTLLPNLLLIHVFDTEADLTWNFPSWSMAAEFWVYGVFAAVVVPTVGRPRLRLVLAALLCAAGGLTVAALSPHRMDATYDFGVPRCLYGFFAGMLLAAFWRAHGHRVPGGTVAEVAALAIAAAFVALSPGTAFEFAAPAVYVVLIAVLAREAGLPSRLLRTAPFQTLGRLSYSIYLLHALVVTSVVPRIAAAVIALAPGRPAVAMVAIPVLYVALVALLASATRRFVELPGRRLFEGLAARAARGTGPSTAGAAVEG
ncbi:acyltransferase family protein [Oharaeibacter diazotrophicus]|uniref:acyltransferase family protein n=1 Tax=Oharaeibacter diazotrophicus TaxID=1920512 RepID=UPI000DC7EB66|nr:acyltransferase [Oharaeibacter diazotrophicus]BBE74750.1 acyltransferase family protein [Pleomorphomonas sp. SM30]GLS77133.1 acyltransferase [Oharaeibacter diazotrophicus]